MENYVESVEEVGDHQYPPKSVLLPRNKWSPLRQFPTVDGKTFVEYESW